MRVQAGPFQHAKYGVIPACTYCSEKAVNSLSSPDWSIAVTRYERERFAEQAKFSYNPQMYPRSRPWELPGYDPKTYAVPYIKMSHAGATERNHRASVMVTGVGIDTHLCGLVRKKDKFKWGRELYAGLNPCGGCINAEYLSAAAHEQACRLGEPAPPAYQHCHECGALHRPISLSASPECSKCGKSCGLNSPREWKGPYEQQLDDALGKRANKGLSQEEHREAADKVAALRLEALRKLGSRSAEAACEASDAAEKRLTDEQFAERAANNVQELQTAARLSDAGLTDANLTDEQFAERAASNVQELHDGGIVAVKYGEFRASSMHAAPNMPREVPW